MQVSLGAQELNCNVQIVSQQVMGTNKQVYQTLQTAIFEFLNHQAWSSNLFRQEERIECNMLINVTAQPAADQFQATMQIQSRRPVFGSSYNSVMLNYMDNYIQFNYVEFQPLDYNESANTNNLTSLLAFYAYFILGLDYDTYSLYGGTEFFQKAERIVDNMQSAAEKGWKAFDDKSNKDRYWLIKNMLDKNYEPIREFNYKYHRLGLDMMDTKTTEGRAEIADDLKLLQNVYRQKPDPYMYLLQVEFDAKADEIANIFSEPYPEENARVLTILGEIDAANARKYDKIKK
jgi:Domain of unknown function (DUF4835)